MLCVKEGGQKEINRYYTLMQMDFDEEELLPKLVIRKGILDGSMELLVFYDDKTGFEVGYALTFIKGIYGYILLKYFGIAPWYRDHHMGVEAMRLINRRYAAKQGIVAEIAEFPDEDEDHIPKLKKFFARFGYVKIPCDYRISGTEVNLMVKPIKGGWDIAGIAHRMIRDFYSRCLPLPSVSKMIDIKKTDVPKAE